MVILGIDPGSTITGYGAIEAAKERPLSCLDYGGIHLATVADFHGKIKRIYDEIGGLISKHRPDFIVLEDIFYSQNAQAALKLGQARGASILAALNNQVPVAAYSAREVKQAITGHGAASKEQVRRMVEAILRLEIRISPLDASDALAIAICHAGRLKLA
ncbi:crossover junction endodeoxyribonuclease RuvC [candidate division KSB1 bacterium RBG_16_48_16]|nr:MAG: crossover junction endodeoxyribonuclease RuvC [candidate division KSB1 bacterium RBG_16_48_16]